MLRSFVGNNSTIKGSSLHRKDPQEVHPYCIPIHCPKNCVRCILESSPFLARPYRCRSPEEIAEFNIAEVCESVCWENSKSLYKPNIKKLEWKGAKTMFGSFSAIFWIPLVSQTPRQMTLCYPRDEKKNGRRLRLVWAWEIFRTPSWRCRRAEIFLVGICWNWNCPSPTMAYSKASFLEFIFYYELALEVFICYYELAFEIMYLDTSRTWYLQAMFSSKQYLSCPWTPLDSLSTLGRWMCYHWSRGGLWKLITRGDKQCYPVIGMGWGLSFPWSSPWGTGLTVSVKASRWSHHGKPGGLGGHQLEWPKACWYAVKWYQCSERVAGAGFWAFGRRTRRWDEFF